MSIFLAAVIVLLVSLHAGAIVPLIAATAVAGAAQGATFAASMRALLAEGRPADRAGILAAIYVLSYSGAAVPSLIAGQLSRSLSLFDIAVGYGVLAAIAFVITLATARGEPHSRSMQVTRTGPEQPVSARR